MVLRASARALVRCAVSRHVRSRHYWQSSLSRDLDRISGDLDALLWAAGCLWALRVERLIGRAPPGVESETQRAFIKFVLYLAAIVLIGLVSPGSPRRRMFVAGAFPLLGLVAVVAFTLGMQIANCIIRIAEYPIEEAILRGLTLGLLIAMVLSMPAALFYRSSAVPVVILTVVPAMQKRMRLPRNRPSRPTQTFCSGNSGQFCVPLLSSRFRRTSASNCKAAPWRGKKADTRVLPVVREW